MKKTILAALAALSLGGCATLFDNKPDIVTVAKPIPVPNIQPSPMNLQEVQWQVYTLDEMKALVAQMEASGQTNEVFYVLPREQYNALAMNLAEMKRFIQDQKSTNTYLVEAIEANNKAAEEAEAKQNEPNQ